MGMHYKRCVVPDKEGQGWPGMRVRGAGQAEGTRESFMEIWESRCLTSPGRIP